MSRPARADAYAHPGFAPVADERRGVPLRIEGPLPDGFDGLFLRNGANAMVAPRRAHMFDGEAMLHMVEIRNGEARYSNSYVRTPRQRHVAARGRDPFVSVADVTGGDRGALLRVMVVGWKARLGLAPRLAAIESVAGSTSVLHHRDRLYCLQETGLPFAIDLARDAEGWLAIDGSGAFESFDGHLAFPFSAHPKRDERTGEVHSLGHDIQTGTTRHTVIDAQGEARSAVIAAGTRPPPFFVHDFVLTDTHLIFPDSSLRFDPRGLAQAGGSVARFDHQRPLRFGVIARDHRDGDPVRWFETGTPGHIWHIANGWHEGDAILLHAPVFRDYPGTIPIHTPDEPHAEFVRWRFDLATGESSEEVMLDHFYERPGIDARRAGRATRYTWLLDEGRGGVMGKGVLKYDLIDRRECGYLDYGPLHGGEPLFVPRGPGEDDGWILDLLADGERAVVIVADAATMIERCRIHLPRRVPFGVHGLWLDRAAIDTLSIPS